MKISYIEDELIIAEKELRIKVYDNDYLLPEIMEMFEKFLYKVFSKGVEVGEASQTMSNEIQNSKAY